MTPNTQDGHNNRFVVAILGGLAGLLIVLAALYRFQRAEIPSELWMAFSAIVGILGGVLMPGNRQGASAVGTAQSVNVESPAVTVENEAKP